MGKCGAKCGNKCALKAKYCKTCGGFVALLRKLRLSRPWLEARDSLGAKDCTPEINTSEIIVDFQWHVPMDCQRYVPKDCHFPSGFLLEMSYGLSVAFSNGISLL